MVNRPAGGSVRRLDATAGSRLDAERRGAGDKSAISQAFPCELLGGTLRATLSLVMSLMTWRT